MKFLVLSDLHGLVPRISKIVQQEQPDAILLAGDIPQTIDYPVLFYNYIIKRSKRDSYINDIQGRFEERLARLQIYSGNKILKQILKFGLPTIAIHGNIETPQFRDWMDVFSERHETFFWISDRSIMIDDVQILGCGWVASENGRAKSFGEVHPIQVYRRLNHLGKQIREDARLRILLSHSPPYMTTLDFIPHKRLHAGSKPIRNFLATDKVDAIICGHIHESPNAYRSHEGWWGVNAGALVEDMACIVDTEKKLIKWYNKVSNTLSPTSILYRFRWKLNYDKKERQNGLKVPMSKIEAST